MILNHGSNCGCLQCQYARWHITIVPQDYVPLSQAGYAEYCVNSHKGQREMTAEDLGMRAGKWLGDEYLALLGEAYWDFAFGRRKAPEAPYAFWLGAEAA